MYLEPGPNVEAPSLTDELPNPYVRLLLVERAGGSSDLRVSKEEGGEWPEG